MDKTGIKVTASAVIPFPGEGVERFLYVLTSKDNLWGPPAGKVNLFERPDCAAVRETFEETALRIRINYLISISQFKSSHGNHVLNFTYAGRIVSGIPRAMSEEGILEVKAFSFEELKRLNLKGQLRAGQVNVKIVEDYLAGRRIANKSFRNYI